MDHNSTITASRIAPRRAPRQNTSNRVCMAEDCATRLSRYNLRAYCHAHWPTTFPRQRGAESKYAA
jgi:hypothetical protein